MVKIWEEPIHELSSTGSFQNQQGRYSLHRSTWMFNIQYLKNQHQYSPYKTYENVQYLAQADTSSLNQMVKIWMERWVVNYRFFSELTRLTFIVQINGNAQYPISNKSTWNSLYKTYENVQSGWHSEGVFKKNDVLNRMVKIWIERYNHELSTTSSFQNQQGRHSLYRSMGMFNIQ